MVNRFGLNRAIPEGIRRQVRQDCGFACVTCGGIGQHYDHFDPEFADAIEHRAGGIALLCATCHQDKTSSRLSNEQVGIARAKARTRWNDPAWRSHFTGGLARLGFGSSELVGRSVGLAFGPLDLLRIEATDDMSEPWTLSGALTQDSGDVVRFERNEVVVCSGNWDVQFEGRLLTFRRAARDIVLQLQIDPNRIAITRMNLRWPSGLQLQITPAGELLLDNLWHAENNNRGQNWKFTNLTVIGTPGELSHGGSGIQFGRNHTVTNFTVQNVVLRAQTGIVDFNTLINVERFISADLLKL